MSCQNRKVMSEMFTATLTEIADLFDTAIANVNDDLTLMRCIGAYTTELEETRLDDTGILPDIWFWRWFLGYLIGSENSLPLLHFGSTMVEHQFIPKSSS